MAHPVQKKEEPVIVVPEGEPSVQSPTELRRLKQIGVAKAKLLTPSYDERFKYGMELRFEDRQFLLRNKIEARTLVTAVMQEGTGEYLLRGNDSGGSTVEMGHVVAYLGTTEAPLALRHSYDNVIPNQTHSLVFGKELVRVEVYRYRGTYSVGVTFYMLSLALSKDGRPVPVKRSLFFDSSGRLDGVPESDPYFGLPEFLSKRGGVRRIHADLHEAVRRAVSISSCLACNHDHFRLFGPLNISNILNGRQSDEERKRERDAAKARRAEQTNRPSVISIEVPKTTSSQRKTAGANA